MVECPICKASIRPTKINKHLDSGCLNVKGPLADQVRPSHWDDFHQSSNIEFLQSIDKTPSCLFWGPPGCGKTTLARILGKSAKFLELSATTHNVADVRAAIDSAKSINSLVGQSTVIFIDEIHRFSKSQQDVLLVPVERGDIVLIAATTENPSFCVNAALLSRLRVIVLEKLDPKTIQKILWRALKIKNTPDGVIQNVIVEQLSLICDGDARTALNCLEIALGLSKNSTPVTTDMLLQILQRSHFNYDRNGDEHFNTISALHKSIRGSDANAVLFFYLVDLLARSDAVRGRRSHIYSSQAGPLCLRRYWNSRLSCSCYFNVCT
jgi:putative ATPase